MKGKYSKPLALLQEDSARLHLEIFDQTEVMVLNRRNNVKHKSLCAETIKYFVMNCSLIYFPSCTICKGLSTQLIYT